MKTKKKTRNIDDVIHDLKVIGEYFQEQSGAIPTCIPEAIALLEAQKLLKEFLK